MTLGMNTRHSSIYYSNIGALECRKKKKKLKVEQMRCQRVYREI